MQDSDLREERLYLFQFPSPFPTFVSPDTSLPAAAEDVAMSDDTTSKKVAFADTVKPEPGASNGAPAEAETAPPKVEGVIGRLEVYRSGAVKMRLANGIVLDVCSSFCIDIFRCEADSMVTGHCSYSTVFPPTGRPP